MKWNGPSTSTCLCEGVISVSHYLSIKLFISRWNSSLLANLFMKDTTESVFTLDFWRDVLICAIVVFNVRESILGVFANFFRGRIMSGNLLMPLHLVYAFLPFFAKWGFHLGYSFHDGWPPSFSVGQVIIRNDWWQVLSMLIGTAFFLGCRATNFTKGV
jgi:hypothetical protein